MRIDETVTDQDLESVAGGWCATPVPPPPRCWPPRPLPGFPPRPIVCPGPLTYGGPGIGQDSDV